jgi:hypothetical protein
MFFNDFDVNIDFDYKKHLGKSKMKSITGTKCRNHCFCRLNRASGNSPPDSPEVGGATAAPNPPSTRAGGQDDSSLQTPSNNIIYNIIYYNIIYNIII